MHSLLSPSDSCSFFPTAKEHVVLKKFELDDVRFSRMFFSRNLSAKHSFVGNPGVSKSTDVERTNSAWKEGWPDFNGFVGPTGCLLGK